MNGRFAIAILCLFVVTTSVFAADAPLTPTKRPPLPELRPEMTLEQATAYAADFDGEDDDISALTQADLWDRIDKGGWPDSLGNFQHRFQPGKSYLTLYKKLPIWPIDMRSPDRFKRAMTAREFFDKSSIGHMSIGWSCSVPKRAGPADREEGFAAETGEDGQQSEMLRTGWGVTSMISTFTDGHLQNGPDVQNYFAREFVTHKLEQPYFAMVIEVPSQDCESVRGFVKSFVMHPTKPYENFGMMPDPMKLEGAGCGSFAIASLSHASSLKSLTDSLWRTVSIPEKLLGRRTRVYLPNKVTPAAVAMTDKEERTISKYHLALMNWDAGKIGMRLHVADPELTVFAFKNLTALAIEKSIVRPTAYQLTHLKPITRFFNFGSGNQESNFDNKDVGYQEIDALFDPSFGAVAKSVSAWWSEREARSQINLVSIPLGVGVMIESRR